MSKEVIAIAGHPGTGKTALARQLAKILRVPLYEEIPASANPYLTDFYANVPQETKSDPHNAWAFLVQQVFLQEAVTQGREIMNGVHPRYVWESPPLSHFMFAWLHQQSGRMSKDEWRMYKNEYQKKVADLISPTVLLVTTLTDIDELQRRIHLRATQEPGRAGEIDTPSWYWRSQARYWQERLRDQRPTPGETHAPPYPMIELKADEIDWTQPEGLRQVLRLLSTHLPSVSATLIKFFGAY